MAIFLNTAKISYWIKKLIEESQNELVLVVPYIRTSESIFKTLEEANERGVEITLIYREDKLTRDEKNKITRLDNLNLLHHPNIHCKCYFNGKLIIICSMNLYEYSERNNREMGVLLHTQSLEDENEEYTNRDDMKLFNDAIDEIREIINGSEIEQISPQKGNNSFKIDIVKTKEEVEYEKSQEINKYFLNKIFKPIQEGVLWVSTCRNYYDKVDVLFEKNRFSIKLNLSNDELEEIYNQWMRMYDEYEFKGFKYYWNYPTGPILLYKDNDFPWNEIEDLSIYYRKIKQGIDLIIKRYRNTSGK